MLRALVMNLELETQLTELHSRLNADSTLHLATGPAVFHREMTPGDFTEASYRGYVAADLVDEWSEPVKRHDGFWSIKTVFLTFTPTAEGEGPTAQTVKGFYLLIGDSVSFAGLFPGPINLQLGGKPLEMAVEIQLSDGQVFLSLSLV